MCFQRYFRAGRKLTFQKRAGGRDVSPLAARIYLSTESCPEGNMTGISGYFRAKNMDLSVVRAVS